jgi:hypothetical protein
MNKKTAGIAFVTIAILIAGVAFILSPLFDAYTRLWAIYVFGPLHLRDWPAPLSVAVAAVLIYLPIVLVGFLIGYAFRPLFRESEPAEFYEESVERLEDSRQSVLDTLTGLENLSKAIDENFHKYDEVRSRFENATAMMRQDSFELKERVDYVYRETRLQRWVIAIVSFVLGVAGKMTVDYVTNMLNAK